MALSKAERELIVGIQLNADVSIPEIARYIRKPQHVLSYALSKLRNKGLLIYHPFIDIGALGFTQYTIFFTVSGGGRFSRRDLIKHLVSSEQVSWVGELGGEFQCGVSICVRSVSEASEFFSSLSTKFGGLFFDKSISVLSRLFHFRMKYLSSKKGPVDYLAIGQTQFFRECDSLDHKILAGLAQAQSPSKRELARQLGVPHSTVDYRLNKLTQAGVITGHSYLVNTTSLGIHMYLLLVYAKTTDEKFRKTLFEYCLNHPNVNFLVEYLGAWDYEVGVEMDNPTVLADITEDMYSRFGENLNNIKVLQVLKFPKVSKYPFVSKNPFG